MKQLITLLVLFGLAATAHAAEAVDKSKTASKAEKQKAVAPVVQAEKQKTTASAAEKLKEASAAEKPAAAPVLSAEEQAARSLKGIENQRAWIATLEKQLDGEKAKLAQIETEHERAYGAKAKPKAASQKS